MQIYNQPKFVLLGGGTGSFTILSALKNYVQDLTALVSMADDGGSTGQLRDEYGVLPPGDIRQCLVALSESSHMRELFNYRFPGEGSLGGHSFGNLFLSALEMNSRGLDEAIEIASDILRIRGKVIPITLDNCELVYEGSDGRIVFGENKIERTDIASDQRPLLRFKQPARIAPAAERAIEDADMIVIAPGSLYTSLIPLLLVSGVPKLLQATRAKVVYIANLINKPLETRNFAVNDYVEELERYAGEGVIDYVLYNVDQPDDDLLHKYAKDEEFPVLINQAAFENASYEAIPGNFLSHQSPNPNQPASRSLIRHDADTISRALMKIYYS